MRRRLRALGLVPRGLAPTDQSTKSDHPRPTPGWWASLIDPMAGLVRPTLKTQEMAAELGISEKMLRRLKNHRRSPFVEGKHYRYQGLTTGAPVAWFPAETDEAFTNFKRVDPKDIETMNGER